MSELIRANLNRALWLLLGVFATLTVVLLVQLMTTVKTPATEVASSVNSAGGPKGATSITSAISALASGDVRQALGQPDPRWDAILNRDLDYLASGSHDATSATNLNPLYAGAYPPAVEARRRSDGSLNPIDLPSSLGLTASELQVARLAESVPNRVLFYGQNEGVARPGQPQNVNDSFDLLAWVQQLKDMQAGKVPTLVQENGYHWTKADIDINLRVAQDEVALNKQLWNDRWQARWAMLRASGMGKIADQEQATVKLVDASELKLTGPEFPPGIGTGH